MIMVLSAAPRSVVSFNCNVMLDECYILSLTGRTLKLPHTCCTVVFPCSQGTQDTPPPPAPSNYIDQARYVQHEGECTDFIEDVGCCVRATTEKLQISTSQQSLTSLCVHSALSLHFHQRLNASIFCTTNVGSTLALNL